MGGSRRAASRRPVTMPGHRRGTALPSSWKHRRPAGGPSAEAAATAPVPDARGRGGAMAPVLLVPTGVTSRRAVIATLAVMCAAVPVFAGEPDRQTEQL